MRPLKLIGRRSARIGTHPGYVHYLRVARFLDNYPSKGAVYAITREAENRIQAAGDQALKQDICNLLAHGMTSSSISQLGDGNFLLASRNVGKRWAESAARDAVEKRIE